MFCPQCATENNEEQKFCRQCGLSLLGARFALEGRAADLVRRGGQAQLMVLAGTISSLLGMGILFLSAVINLEGLIIVACLFILVGLLLSILCFSRLSVFAPRSVGGRHDERVQLSGSKQANGALPHAPGTDPLTAHERGYHSPFEDTTLDLASAKRARRPDSQ